MHVRVRGARIGLGDAWNVLDAAVAVAARSRLATEQLEEDDRRARGLGQPGGLLGIKLGCF